MFGTELEKLDLNLVKEKLTETDPEKITGLLSKEHLSFEDYLLLLSPAAESRLAEIAARAQVLTRMHFGKVIQFYVPLYLSNYCQNSCQYCGYNFNSQLKRITLSGDQIEDEMKYLAKRGFTSILLLTGEDKDQVDIKYLEKAVTLAANYFELVALEIYPLNESEYHRLVRAGADGLTIYQETYDRKTYDNVHLSGPKKNYLWRLETPERALQAGIRKIGLGVLLGLTDWRLDIATLGYHLQYLIKKYWKTEFTISFPRIRNQGVGFQPDVQVSDKNIVQMILAMRLFQPAVGLIASTREEADFRDKLIDIGVTQLSAESKTNPGGYSGQQSLSQFEISDQRELGQIIKVLEQKGYDPVMKDWHKAFSFGDSG